MNIGTGEFADVLADLGDAAGGEVGADPGLDGGDRRRHHPTVRTVRRRDQTPFE